MPQLTDTHITQSDTPESNVVQGKHKHHLTECLHENSDPLSCKRARKKAASSAALTGSTSLSWQGLDTAALSDDGLDIQPINIDNSDLKDSRKNDDDEREREATKLDESDNAELGKSSIAYIWPHYLSDI